MKKRTQSKFLTKHIEDYSSYYIFHTVLLIMGVIFGAIVVNSLSVIQKTICFTSLTSFYTSC